MNKAGRRSDCPISSSLDVWGDKWSLLIIRDLMYGQGCTYNDFLKAPEKIATNILAARLKTLEANNLIEKVSQPDNKRKSIYRLTPMGIDLLPAMIEISLWAEKYFTISEDRKAMLSRVKTDKTRIIEAMMQKLMAERQQER